MHHDEYCSAVPMVCMDAPVAKAEKSTYLALHRPIPPLHNARFEYQRGRLGHPQLLGRTRGRSLSLVGWKRWNRRVRMQKVPVLYK